MHHLIADRFFCRLRAGRELFGVGARTFTSIDLASGRTVKVRIAAAGGRREQQQWNERCARKYLDGALVDYGCIGASWKFEARAAGMERSGRPRATPPVVIEWLNHRPPSSTGVLRVDGPVDARDLRVHGFVPLSLPSLGEMPPDAVSRLLSGRSIAILDWTGSAQSVALALLSLGTRSAREICVLSVEGERRAAQGLRYRAAESRAAYEVHRSRLNERPSGMLADAERLRAAGRHAAAERLLRSAAAAFDRRDEKVQAGHAELELGRLLLTRGRAADAAGAFERAHDRFQHAHAAAPAVHAILSLGMAQTDLLRLPDAERSCRAAWASAAALNDGDAIATAAVALGRTLFWQGQYADARDVLESAPPPLEAHACARYWCLLTRLRLMGDGFHDARAALQRARPPAGSCDPAIEALVRRWEAIFQSRIGDRRAVEFHAHAGLAAARAAHLPLAALKLRLVLLEALLDGGNVGRWRPMVARLSRVSHATVPPLLRSRIEVLLERMNGCERTAGSAPGLAAHETAARFYAPAPNPVSDLDAVREVLATSQHEDERAALARVAALVRGHTRAAATGFCGRLSGEPRLVASEGTLSIAFARRCCDTGVPIGPERGSAGVEASVPLRYLGRLVGALSVRWPADGPVHADRTMAFIAAAGAVCAPLVHVILERQNTPAPGGLEADIVGDSAAIGEVRRAIHRAANAPFTVLIEGESGSGKELVARAIHRNGCRRERRFCALNCAAMPEDLVDAELFGHAKGAFTGAAVERQGLFESADGGTVFLDEVGELSPRAQAKVLRALQEGEVRRVGENFTRPFDARLVAATNRSLRAEVEAGRFRQDLLYRLDVIRIAVPPLRERAEDIPVLAARFWRASTERLGSKAVLGQGVLAALARYDWPGNVRELQNVLTALAVASPARGVVGARDLPAAIARAAQDAPDESLESARFKFEQRFVRAALARAAGHRGRTASALGLTRQGLAKLLQRLQLEA